MKTKGFIDLQVNGWMGADFTAPGLTLDTVRVITRDLAARGVIAFCPTLITGEIEVYRDNLRVLAAAMKDPAIGPAIAGIHMEGPFISPEPGAVGAHPKALVRPPDEALFDKLQEWAEGGIRIITVAPERPGCLDLIRRAAASGAIVAMGHHLASDDDMAGAVKAGATLCTHVGNGIPNMIPRHDNPLWWQLACDDVSCMFITDGMHLPADFIKTAFRAKTAGRFIVTSDASPLAGMPPGPYTIFGRLDVVIEPSGRIFAPSTKALAGSHSTMLECMNHLASLDLMSEPELWLAGMGNQAALLGIDIEKAAHAAGSSVSLGNRGFVVKQT